MKHLLLPEQGQSLPLQRGPAGLDLLCLLLTNASCLVGENGGQHLLLARCHTGHEGLLHAAHKCAARHHGIAVWWGHGQKMRMERKQLMLRLQRWRREHVIKHGFRLRPVTVTQPPPTRVQQYSTTFLKSKNILNRQPHYKCMCNLRFTNL